jgi:signal transduction histidine kinase
MGLVNLPRNPVGTGILTVDRRGSRVRSAVWRYGFAVLAVAGAAILMVGWRQFFVEPAVAPFLAAILLTGWYAGGVPVVLTTVLSVLVYLLLFPAPFLELNGALAARLVWFLAFACLAAWFGAARRTAVDRLEGARSELEERVAARTAELHRSETYLLAAQQARFAAMLDERARLAREIHDTLLQGFTGVALNLVAVTHRMDGPPEIVAALRDVIALAQGTLGDARRAVWDMRSPPHADDDFVATLRAAAEASVRGTRLGFEYAVEGRVRPVNPDVAATVLRVAQEAIANAVKHAAARTVRLTLTYETRRIRLSVTDDGRGFAVDPDFRAHGGHWGLLGMQERAGQINGTLSVRSTPGHGTEVVLIVPILRPLAVRAAV